MSPFGGGGLNSGVEAAWNLVWKLVLVRAGLAPETLLETYHHERHAAAVENLRLTDNTMRFLVPSPGFARLKRDTILRLSLPFKFMRRYVNAGHMSNPFTYRDSPIISEDNQSIPAGRIPPEQRSAFKRYQLGPPAGALAPVVILTDANNNQPVSLLDRFGQSFVVFYFCTDPDAGISTLQKILAHLPPIPTSLYLVVPRPPTTPLVDNICILLDEEGKAT